MHHHQGHHHICKKKFWVQRGTREIRSLPVMPWESPDNVFNNFNPQDELMPMTVSSNLTHSLNDDYRWFQIFQHPDNWGGIEWGMVEIWQILRTSISFAVYMVCSSHQFGWHFTSQKYLYIAGIHWSWLVFCYWLHLNGYYILSA